MAAGGRWRKLGLVLHMTRSVGWLGAAAAVAALAVAGPARPGQPAWQSASLAAIQVATRWAAFPLAAAALLSGLLQSWISPWRLLRHWWVLFKLVLGLLGLLILYVHTQGFGPAATHTGSAHPAAVTGPRAAPALASSLPHASGGIAVLLINVVLSVSKPRGLTPWARPTSARRTISRTVTRS